MYYHYGLNKVKIDGIIYYLDPKDFISLNLLVNKVYEPTQTKLVKRIIKPGNVVVDIGANIGYYTLLFAKLVGPQGKVYAFEPDINNFKLLSKNIKANPYNNIILENKAVSDVTGKIKLYLSKDGTGAHKIHNKKNDREFIYVDSIALDDYFRSKKINIDFIKMDIEGAEVKALKGMKKLISSNTNLKLISEFNPTDILDIGDSPETYLESLYHLFGEVYNIDENSEEIIKYDMKKFIRKIKDGSLTPTNLLCIKK